MFFGYNSAPNSNISQTQSILHESQVLSLQRESENYIRKVEQDKKHHYNIEETWVTTKKEWQQKKEQIKKIQHDQTLPAAKQQLNKIKNLQNALEQSILKYNESQTQNLELKKQINMLRKERHQYINIHQDLQEELLRIENETVTNEAFRNSNEIQAQKKKETIAEMKKKNDQEKEKYVEQFDRLKKEVMEEKKKHDLDNLGLKKEKAANIDTASTLKLRLKKLISNNKEKVKLIDTYWKNMKVIEDAFNQIKEASGIQDIEEIMNTFIKSEEQNYSLYNYVDILSQQIDQLQDQNQDLKKKIDSQRVENESKKRLLMATPQAERHRKKNELIIKKRQEEINTLRKQMEEIGPTLKDALIELSQTQLASDPTAHLDYKLSFNLNESSLEKYLQDLERFIDLAVAKEKIAQNQSIAQSTLLLDEIPLKEFKGSNKQFNEDELLKQESQQQQYNKLLTQKALRDMAVESLKKKK
ncbi:unnamed protein product [Paramecium primaurelia]|uniref:ODAD1 central coiled coil region domain-containing protein n=2 Tax=Paramecium TaxID=5884 RepID=A0A8S1V6S6_9CILI|nr:unnamed protein product [Paramecium primaurelia]CAD8172564.1 unnamed protein product [Paramecium pentaurelia]